MKNAPVLVTAVVAIALLLVAFVWSYLFLIVPAQETLDQQVHDVASQLKCPVCQGESVADSPSTISQQMRGVIRQQLQAGKTKQQVIQYFVDRYGDQILWSPPWQGFFLIAWIVPLVLLLAGIVLLSLVLKGWRAAALARQGHTEEIPAGVDDTGLSYYRAQLEQELAAEDPLFQARQTEVR